MKKKALAMLLVGVMSLGLVACGGGGSAAPAASSSAAEETTEEETEEEAEAEEESEEAAAPSADGTQVGIVLPTKDEPRWLQDEKSFASALQEAGFSSSVLFSQTSSSVELGNVEALIEEGIQVLVICAQDAAAAGAAVQKAKDAGVTVVCYDRLITGTDAVDYYVTFNSFAVGVEQGQFLIDAYQGQKDVPLYLYSGAVTDNNAFIFFAGAWSVLSKAVESGQFVVENCPAIEEYIGQELDVDADHDVLSTILGTITTNWDFSVAKTLAEANLVANDADAKGDVAILAPNDGTARAIADAFTADSDVSSYVITGQDAENASLKYIQDGKQSMTVWKNTATLAETTCELVNGILGGGTPSTTTTYNNQNVDVPSVEEAVTVITETNLEDLISEGYFSQSEIDAAE